MERLEGGRGLKVENNRCGGMRAEKRKSEESCKVVQNGKNERKWEEKRRKEAKRGENRRKETKINEKRGKETKEGEKDKKRRK